MTSASNTPQKQPKSKNRNANQAAVAQIAELYPKTFDREAVKPLKIGIQEDLVADGKLPQGKIKRALASYVRSPLYYKALQAGAVRVDLNGEAAGEVTEQEAEHAQAMLKKQREQKQQRIKAEREKAKVERQQAREERFNNKLEQLLRKNS